MKSRRPRPPPGGRAIRSAPGARPPRAAPESGKSRIPARSAPTTLSYLSLIDSRVVAAYDRAVAHQKAARALCEQCDKLLEDARSMRAAAKLDVARAQEALSDAIDLTRKLQEERAGGLTQPEAGQPKSPS